MNQDNLEPQDCLEKPDREDYQVPQVQLVRWEFRVGLECQAERAPQANMDSPASLENLAGLDKLAELDQEDFLENPEPQERLEQLEWLDCEDQQVHLDLAVPRVYVDELEHPVQRECPVKRVHVASEVRLDFRDRADQKE